MKESILIFMILALPESINNYGYSIYSFLLGIGKTGILVFIQLNNLFFVTVGCLIGFKIFHNSLGLLGYFISVILANIILVFYLYKEVDISLVTIMKNTKSARRAQPYRLVG